MSRALKTMRLLQFFMLASIVAYVVIGEVVKPSARALNPTVNYMVSILSMAIVGIIFVVRRTLVFRAEQTLVSRPDDVISLNHWKTGFVATYALCEALALFGLVLRFMGCNFEQSAPFYLGGFILLFFFRAKQPTLATA